MANKQTRQLRAKSAKHNKRNDLKVTMFTQTSFGSAPNSNGKKHEVYEMTHEQKGNVAFKPERALLKRKRIHTERIQKSNKVVDLRLK